MELNIYPKQNVEGRFWGCFAAGMDVPYCMFGFESDAKSWVETQSVKYEIKPMVVNF